LGLLGKKEPPDDTKWEDMNRAVISLIKEQKIDQAQEVAQELFEYSRSAYGKKHANTATALNNLGFINIMIKDFEKAESFLLMALQVTEKAYGKDTREAAVIYMNLAKLYLAKAREVSTIESAFAQQQAEEEEVAGRLRMRRQNS
jgi:tetratricopeptide (TPR) repeat protein